jgi:multisubunit Na+/H+ antiporter MnhE subunit
MKKLTTTLMLTFRFFVAAVLSGVQTTRVIVSRPPGMTPGFVDYEFAPMTPWGATILGCLITLTPGTTTVDIDMRARRMRLHLLDVRGAESALAEIRRDFERPLCVLFGCEVSA